MSSYILKFDREVDQLINSDDTVFDSSTEDVFNRVITNLDVSNKAHYVSNVRDIVNQEFKKSSVRKICLCCLFICLFGSPILRNLDNFLLRSFYQTPFLELGKQSIPLNEKKNAKATFLVGHCDVSRDFSVHISNY